MFSLTSLVIVGVLSFIVLLILWLVVVSSLKQPVTDVENVGQSIPGDLSTWKLKDAGKKEKRDIKIL